MDYAAFYSNGQQPYGSLGFPPTPHADGDSPPQNNFTFDGFPRYDNIDGIHTPASSQHSAVQAKAQGMDLDGDVTDLHLRQRSSSEEKELTPAQSRRKEQNRQAQRAFRERKEKAFKDLEQKLATMEASSSTILSENAILKQQLHKFQTENEILRATSKMSAPPVVAPEPAVSVGPMSYNPTDFYDNLLKAHTNKTPSHRIVFSPQTGERLLGAGATWDVIVGHPLYKQGLVDVVDVCDRLKGCARCDGQGPVFEENMIMEAICASAASGRDEL